MSFERLRLALSRLACAAICGAVPGIAFLAGAAAAQEAVVSVEENFRAEPNGSILGELRPGTRVLAGARQGGWTEATIRGYVFIPSLQVWTEGDFDLVVSAPEGENLREEPAGRVAGRLARGTLLGEVRRIPGWIEVRRSGWIWSESLEAAAGPAVPSPDPVAPDPESGVSAGDAGGPPDTFVRSAAGDAPVLATPDGDTLAYARPGADLRVLAREGSWARVQLDGWVWLPGLDPTAGGPDGANGTTVLSGVSMSDLAGDPEAFVGRLVELDLQFISLERAELVRPDFYEGEPFLLTRSVEGERTFVYVTVPPERVAEVESIVPLERIRVVARVRSVAAALTGNPVLDLVEVR